MAFCKAWWEIRARTNNNPLKFAAYLDEKGIFKSSLKFLDIQNFKLRKHQANFLKTLPFKSGAHATLYISRKKCFKYEIF